MQLAGGHGPRPFNGQATPALPPDVVTATQRGRVSTYPFYLLVLPSFFLSFSHLAFRLPPCSTSTFVWPAAHPAEAQPAEDQIVIDPPVRIF